MVVVGVAVVVTVVGVRVVVMAAGAMAVEARVAEAMEVVTGRRSSRAGSGGRPLPCRTWASASKGRRVRDDHDRRRVPCSANCAHRPS